MTTENSQKSKKYVVTKLVAPDESPLGRLAEKQLCRCDTLKECAEFILNNKDQKFTKTQQFIGNRFFVNKILQTYQQKPLTMSVVFSILNMNN